MTKYIDAERAEKLITEAIDAGLATSAADVAELLSDMPAEHVMPAPVDEGERWTEVTATGWQWEADGAHPVMKTLYLHGECGKVCREKENYCPRCGKRLR